MCHAVCFHCMQPTICWDSDFTGDEVYGNGDTDGLVHMCHCSNCGAEVQYYIRGEGFEE